MRNTVKYEWDYETVEDGDIIDHNPVDKLSEFGEGDVTDTLVLVRHSGNENAGLKERCWAYVTDGKLPEWFVDDYGNPQYKVPQRYHAELLTYLK